MALTAAYAVRLVAQHTIQVVEMRHLLPRWDLATHAAHGWLDAHLLATGRVPPLLWDLWMQGYWPPVPSLWQMPFHALHGGGLAPALWSSAAAFVLVAVVGSAVLWRQWRTAAFLPIASFVGLLVTSPFLLAYAVVPMTETLGALAQLVVVLCYQRYRERPAYDTARALAISLTILFFTKYNYFILLVAPLVLYEYLERTSGWPLARRARRLGMAAARFLASPAGALLAVYGVALVAILATGGFEFRVFGERVSVRGIGASGHAVLYLLLGRLAWLHWRNRIDWQRVFAADTRARAMLLWFAVPVTVWMASPHPNHIRDFFNLVVNRPMGQPTVEAGLSAYLSAVRDQYFYADALLAMVGVLFLSAAIRYRGQPPGVKWIVLAMPFQLAAIVVHQTRFPRFLLLTIVLLCLGAALELGRWLSASRAARLAGGALAPMVLVAGVFGTAHVVGQRRFVAVAFEHYTDSPALADAFRAVRGELRPGLRLLVAGEHDQISPALVRWELGPPSGLPCFPYPVGGERRLAPSRAHRVLLVAPREAPLAPLNVAQYDPSAVAEIVAAVKRGELTLLREHDVPDLGLVMRLFGRNGLPELAGGGC